MRLALDLIDMFRLLRGLSKGYFRHWKTSCFFLNCFSALASKLNTGLINRGMFFPCGIWCVADVSSVSPLSEQTDGLLGNPGKSAF